MAKNEKVEWGGISNCSTEQIENIKTAIDNTYSVLLTIDDCKNELDGIFNDVNENTGIPRRLFNFLAKSNYKKDGDKTISENDEIKETFNALFDNEK